jgi:hypothetical protein
MIKCPLYISLSETFKCAPLPQLRLKHSEELVDAVLLTILHLYTLIGMRSALPYKEGNITVHYTHVRILGNKACQYIFPIPHGLNLKLIGFQVSPPNA